MFVFSNSVIRWFKSNSIEVESVRKEIDNAIASSVSGSSSERTETVRVSGSKTVTASVTVKDVTKAGKLPASVPLRFAYLSQTLSTLEKVGCAPKEVTIDGDLAEWAYKFGRKEKLEPAKA